MLRKYATATIIGAEIATRNALGLVKSSHRAVFNYEPREGFLYVRSRMISSRCNDNWDEFPAEEIKASWKTAIGKPVFVNHRNEDHRRMRGVIIDAALHEDTLPDGRPDIWIEALHEIDAVRFPRLAKAILSGRVNRTSMGCDVGHSLCSACGNRASTPAEYCDHIPRSKGKILYRHTASGEREGHLIREKCFKISFFENSFLVEDPADPTAAVTGIDDRGLKTTASMLKEAVPQGLHFQFTPGHRHHSGHHVLKALLPNGDEVGSLKWSPETQDYGAGMVDMVKTHPDHERQGIASALWRRAHELANEQEDVSVPAHSDVQFPAGRNWAEKVDREPVVTPGQQTLFSVPESSATQITPDQNTQYSDVLQHMKKDHNRADWSTARERGTDLDAAHQNQHKYVEQDHTHASFKTGSLRKLAEDWTHCDQGHEHWGPHGAAGMLIRHRDDDDGETRYLLQKRAPWVDHPDTWGVPGGALEPDESPEEGAQRETEEEMGDLPAGLKHHKTHTDDHGGWAFHTVVADSPKRFQPEGGDDDETQGHGWFTRDEMNDLPLHPGFADTLHKTAGLFKKRRQMDWMADPDRKVTDLNNGLHVLDHLTRDHGWTGAAFEGAGKANGGKGWRKTHDQMHREGVPGMTDDEGMHFHGMRKGAPFAGYDDFEDCQAKNDDKDDPDAYCGEVKHRVEGQYGDPRIKRWKQRFPQGKLPSRESSQVSSLPSVEAYGETKAPADVDTLRTESCPVCGGTDAFDGDRCMVCNFIQPPDMFKDPDTGVAKQMDLRQDSFDQGMVGPNGEPMQMDPSANPEDVNPAGDMPDVPGEPGDQVADLFCPACGFSADTAPPMTTNDPAMPTDQQGLVEGDMCPNCGEATMLSANDVGEMGGAVPQEIADDADADAMPDDQEPDADEDGVPDDTDPAPHGEEEEPPPDEAGDPVEEEGAEDEDPDAVEDDEEAQKGRKDKSRRASRRGHGKDSMNKPKTAATEASSKIAALERQLAAQNEILQVAGQQLHYLATLAGVSPEFEAIKAEGMKKVADIMNPAQPWPDPPAGPPTESTQEAEAPETYDDPRNPGITPGSTQGVPAMATDTPLRPGVTVPTSPVNQLVDVTQPVAGTEEHVPLDQTKIETDVRVGDPMVNKDNPQGYGFPLTGPFAADGAASANTTTSPGMQNRTMASIRLARLRKSAGLTDAQADELAEAAKIEKDAALSTELIVHEINTLDTIAKAANRATGRRPQGGIPPRQATGTRRAPSLVGAPDLTATAGAGESYTLIDGDAADLFM